MSWKINALCSTSCQCCAPVQLPLNDLRDNNFSHFLLARSSWFRYSVIHSSSTKIQFITPKTLLTYIYPTAGTPETTFGIEMKTISSLPQFPPYCCVHFHVEQIFFDFFPFSLLLFRHCHGTLPFLFVFLLLVAVRTQCAASARTNGKHGPSQVCCFSSCIFFHLLVFYPLITAPSSCPQSLRHDTSQSIGKRMIKKRKMSLVSR